MLLPRYLILTLAGMTVIVNAGAHAARFPSADFIYPPVKDKYPPVVDKGVFLTRDFEKVRNLPASDPDRQLATKIAHLELGDGLCSGFLVGPDLLLTNHHCVYDKQKRNLVHLPGAKVYMRYLKDNDGKGGVDAGVERVLKMDEGLDFALLRLTVALGNQHGWLSLEAHSKPHGGDVKVIQHPDGRSKEIARKNSEIIAQHPTALHYRADTEPGSSGSPVFPRQGDKVIALHHSGTRQYNEGILMSAIVPQIREWLLAESISPTTPSQPITPPPRDSDCDPFRDPDCTPFDTRESPPPPVITSPSAPREIPSQGPSGPAGGECDPFKEASCRPF